jgi:hypothetical protein
MTPLIKSLFHPFGGNSSRKSSDFSDFFTKPSADKAKVIRQVLREANQEQRKVMETYRETKA